MDTNISFSKIVPTPNLNSWSQAYNAGKLFAVLSLEKTAEEDQDAGQLNAIGKSLLEKLEQEFFTVEKKNLETIRKAIETTFEEKHEGIFFSFIAGVFKDNILYLFILGKGSVFLKRGEKSSIILSSSENSEETISSSGFLKNNDLIILATESFSEIVRSDALSSDFENSPPFEITESLAPKVHKAEDGKLAGIFIRYNETQTPDEPEELPQADEEEPEEEKPLNQTQVNITEKIRTNLLLLKNKYLSRISLRSIKHGFVFKSKKKIFLLFSAAIIIILITSVFQTINNQNKAKINALFTSVYAQAEKKYEKGQSLLDLNKSLSRDSFLSAQKILQDNKDKFPPDSKEAARIQDLLKKIDNGLSESSPIDKSGLDRSKLSIKVANGSGGEGIAARAAKILVDTGYNSPSLGNADNFKYIGVTIKVKKEKSDFLELLKKDLSKEYTVTSTSPDLPSSSPTEALVIVGK